MIKKKVKNILQEYINKTYGIDEPIEITLDVVMETLEKLSKRD